MEDTYKELIENVVKHPPLRKIYQLVERLSGMHKYPVGIEPTNALDKNTITKTSIYTFHGTQASNINSIFEKGIKANAGVYGTAVYTKQTPNKTLYKHYGNPNAIIAIDVEEALKHAYKEILFRKRETYIPFALKNKKDWILYSYVPVKAITAAFIIENTKENNTPYIDAYGIYLTEKASIPLYVVNANLEELQEPSAYSKEFNILIKRTILENNESDISKNYNLYLPLSEKAPY